jgi:hypothetical protein
MAEASLPDQHAEQIGLDFQVLRDGGIAMLQRLCGELWTDYNLHDPGVTTLEQLVYGLTDLAYRTGFHMADYLTRADGKIDYAGQALYAPDAILCCEALTIDDYRRLIYDAIPEVAEIWIRHLDDGQLSIDVMRGLETGRRDKDHKVPLEQLVRMVYCKHRSLGEDLYEVRVLAPRPYYLRGEIDTCGERSPAEILAQILFDCGNYLSSGMRVERLADVAARGHTPDQVFQGPSMQHGHVTAGKGGAGARTVTVSQLIGVIQKIEGVSRVRNLEFLDAALHPCVELRCDSAHDSYPTLPFPDQEAHIELLCLRPVQGMEYGVSEQVLPSSAAWRIHNRLVYDEAGLEFHKLHFERHAFRTEPNHSLACYPLPVGRQRDLRAYYSIQHEFPAVYGIGQYGLPHDASPQRKTEARQLKAYLYPFEQLMANYLQNLQDFPTLFSASETAPAHSYFSQHLGERGIPQIGELYAADTATMPALVHQALARQDDYFERKSRLYDYLLALYGEAFPQSALRRFNHYHKDDTDAWLLEAKRRLIGALVDLSAGRGRAFDYLKQRDQSSNLAPLQVRVAILLGLDGDQERRSLGPVWHGQPLELVDDSVPGTGGAKVEVPPGLALVPQLPLADRGRPLVPDLLAPDGAFPESLFRSGAVLANYRLGDSAGKLWLYCEVGGNWLALRPYASRVAAVRAAHRSVAALQRLNRESEGMHLVEHILLRPFGHFTAQAHEPHFRSAYYISRISVVLPRWTLRCADADFRNFVEETVRQHCPAHILASFLWLAPADMARFEALQSTWHDALRDYHRFGSESLEPRGRARHDAAAALVRFLRLHKVDPV